MAPFFAVGAFTDRIPGGRPKLPSDTSIENLFAVGTGGADTTKIQWFLCRTNQEFNEWMAQIKSILPPPPPQQPTGPSDGNQTRPAAPPLPSVQPSAPPPYCKIFNLFNYCSHESRLFKTKFASFNGVFAKNIIISSNISAAIFA